MENNFLSLGIRSELNDILQKYGINEPTPVQESVIPLLLKGKDIIVQSQTGTGKTLAFLLPLLGGIDAEKPFIQALIITPTRELAIQITKEAEKLASILDINVLALFGGKDAERQVRKLKGSPHLVIGTPGRIVDHILRKTVNFSHIKMLVLDEADVILYMGFLQEVEHIMKQTPGTRQTTLFSATIPRGIRTLAAHYMRKPEEVKILGRRITLDEIDDYIVETSEEGKVDALCRIIDEANPYLAIIFCKTKTRAIELNEELIKRGYNCDELHGDLSQVKRQNVMKRFRDAKLQILVATDIAARGLDIEGVTHIFSYDMPQDSESYIHRTGRTGRAGEKGVAYTLATQKDLNALKIIEAGINRKIPRLGGDESKPGHKNKTASRPRQQTKEKVKLSSFKRGAFEREEKRARKAVERSRVKSRGKK